MDTGAKLYNSNYDNCNLAGDGGWYRAVLVSKSAQQAEVTYVDFGNSEKIHMNDIRPIYKEFMKLPAQAFVCCLSDARIKQGKQWSTKEVETFSNMVLENHLIAQVKKKGLFTL